MIEHYSHDEITAVPTPEIARWTARIERTNMALRYNGRVFRGGDTDMSDDGIVESIIAQRAIEQNKDWTQDPDYEDAILYELKPDLHYYKVIEEPYAEPSAFEGDDRYDAVTRLSWQIGRAALKVGLERLGLYSAEQQAPPVGAVAALSLARSSIEEETDRALYNRKSEIEEAVISIASIAKARGVPFRSRVDGSNQLVPVYQMLAWPVPKTTERLGLDHESSVTPWWQELQRDLARIDEAIGSL